MKATPKEVGAWARLHVHEYETATELAEAAAIEFDLPGRGLDDPDHWCWDVAVDVLNRYLADDLGIEFDEYGRVYTDID